uniref:Uncharacterized protein n=2 Tax=Caenorhabditis japonica TaxID=281687 RepID=A0A8R1I8G9_CAEJA
MLVQNRSIVCVGREQMNSMSGRNVVANSRCTGVKKNRRATCFWNVNKTKDLPSVCILMNCLRGQIFPICDVSCSVFLVGGKFGMNDRPMKTATLSKMLLGRMTLLLSQF